MYIWTAADAGCALGDVRAKSEKLAAEFGFDKTAFSLPQHISLKISFFIDDDRASEVIDVLSDYFSSLCHFEVETDKIEVSGRIVWLKIKKTDALLSVHSSLDKMMSEKYGITPHKFDNDFIFHSTLYFGTENEASSMFEILKDQPFPKSFTSDGIFIGTSESGLPGTYKVVRHIGLN